MGSLRHGSSTGKHSRKPPSPHCAMLRQAEIEALFEMRQLMEQQEFLERRQDDDLGLGRCAMVVQHVKKTE